MRIKIAAISMVMAASCLALATAYARPANDRHKKKDSKQTEEIQQIVVFVHKGEKGLEFDLGYGHQKRSDANFTLAELKLQYGSRCQLIVLIDDSLDVGAISQIGKMAINAGFTDIRPFVHWTSTDKIAEVQFGPLIKFETSPEKIDARLGTEKELLDKAEKKRLEKERKKGLGK
jgi:hypothetical protein